MPRSSVCLRSESIFAEEDEGRNETDAWFDIHLTERNERRERLVLWNAYTRTCRKMMKYVGQNDVKSFVSPSREPLSPKIGFA
jgi:hypothetical protein